MGDDKTPRGLIIRTAPHVGEPDPFIYVAVKEISGHLYFDATIGGGFTTKNRDELAKVADTLAAMLERVNTVVEKFETARRVNLHDEKNEGGEAPKA